MPQPDVDNALVVETLQRIAGELNIALAAGDAERLAAYLRLLQRWNATYNLTAVRDPQAMLTQHLADCLAVVPPLRQCVQERFPEQTVSLLDVGSGGGLPGVVLAVLCPEISVTCVDTVGKKAAFIRQVAGELRLLNLRAVHSRVEQMPGSFEIVTSRAFATLADFTGLTEKRLAPSGVWLAMKGRHPQAELDGLSPSVAVFHVEQVTVPGLDAERCLVWMRRATESG